MKAREVMKLLNICRTTLYHYTKNNIIKHTKLSNGYYDYDEHSVLKFIKKDNRYDVIYARVSTYKQKKTTITLKCYFAVAQFVSLTHIYLIF